MREESFEKIKNLISQDELKAALEVLHSETKGTKYERQRIMLLSEFNRINKEHLHGTLTDQDKSVRNNKLVERLILFLDVVQQIDVQKKRSELTTKRLVPIVITLCLFIIIWNFLRNRNKIVDQRDGQRYSVVKIDTLIWMAENMNYDLKSNSLKKLNQKISKDNLGKLYNFQGAQQACSGFSDGWRLPTKDEISRLSEFIKASPDSIFFKNFLGGESDGTGNFLYRRENGILWTDTEAKDNFVWILYLHGDSKKHEIIDIGDKEFGYSCRCVKKSSN